MTENFAQLFEESLQELETRPGSIVKGTVVSIDKDIVLVDAGLKSESAIPADQFKNAEGELEIAIGDQVDVALDAVMVSVKLSFLAKKRSVTKRGLSWKKLTKIKLLSKALSTVKLKAVSLLKLTVYARSFLVLLLTYVQYVTLRTLKAKSF